MSFVEPLSVPSRATPHTPRTPKTPKTPKRHYAKHDLENIPSQRFRVGYQKVTLDIDLEQQSIIGETELTVLPLDSSLKFIKLDCRGIQVDAIIMNQRKANFVYDDFLQNQEYLNDDANPVLANYPYDPYFDSNSKNINIHQHHLLRGKFYPLFSDQNNREDPSFSFSECTSELKIQIPESIKLRLQSSNSKNTFSPIGTNRSYNGTPMATNTLMNSDKVYTPLNIKISYVIRNSKNGILFHGGKHTNIPKNKWYCYTYNNDIGCSASSWVPCIDNFYEKPSWDINIVVPKTIADIGETKIIGTKEAEKALRKLALEQMDEDDAQRKKNDDGQIGESEVHDDDDDDDNDDELESTPLVVAVPDLVSSREAPHQLDVGKKIVNFQFYNPVCAHHLGFAVGAFEKSPLMDLKPGTNDLVPSSSVTNPGHLVNGEHHDLATLEGNSNEVPTMFYYLPGKKEEVINSTIFLYKALDFYSKEFSSFPFTSYTLVFIEDFPSNICTFAGMTIASEKLLYTPDLIEPIFETTETLSIALAEQYSGVNVLPKTLNDIWCTIGLARYMSLQFLKKLFGYNHYKFTFKQRSGLLCDIDVGKRPLANQSFRFPVNSDQDFEFIKLKSPLVLFILDKRMTKTDKSFGLSRVIPKIFLQAMSNDLTNGNCLSTAHFQRVCEKVAHHKLETFFNNWIHNSGVPTFRITHRFNKKRMFIEMSIRQMQRSNLNKEEPDEKQEINQYAKDYIKTSFVDEANNHIVDQDNFEAQYVFSGPVTVRIHETDGSPYEHILNINDLYTKLDIQYNTKYRRRKKKDGIEEITDEKEKESKKKEEETRIGMLGDVLISAADVENWDLRGEETTKIDENDPDQQRADAFEWLRFDTDCEWICKMTINQNDQMFESQLRQDRDVEAQLQSVKHFGNSLRPTFQYAKILLRTLIDKRYYYGIRVEAAKALGKISNEENDHIGMRYLLKAFKYFYCYNGKITRDFNEFDPKEYLPKSNDFTDFTDLWIMKAIITSLSEIRNKDGDAPMELKKILLSILKYNDNMNNSFNDCFYVCTLLRAISNLIIASNRPISNLNLSITDNLVQKPADFKDQFINDAIMELNRSVKMDEWSPSFQRCITKTVLQEKISIASQGLAKIPFIELLQYIHSNYHEDIRLVAFEGLLLLGGFKNEKVLNLFFTTLKLDDSHYVRYQLIKIFVKCVGVAALYGTPSTLDDEEFLKALSEPDGSGKDGNVGNRMILVEENTSKDAMRSRNDELARKNVKGAIDLLRRDYGIGKGLRKELWDTLHSCLVTINAKRNVFDVVMILYDANDSFIVTTDLPGDKKIVAKIDKQIIEVENGSLVITCKREGRLKIQLPTLKLKSLDNAPKETKPILRLKNVEGSVGKKTVVTSTIPLQKSHDAKPSGSPSKKRKRKFEEEIEKTSITPTVVDIFPTHHVTINQALDVFEIKIKTDKLHRIIKKRKVKSKIIKTAVELPLRYVRFKLITKEVEVSTDENFGEVNNVVKKEKEELQEKEPTKDGLIKSPEIINESIISCPITLRISSSKWKEFLNPPSPAKPKLTHSWETNGVSDILTKLNPIKRESSSSPSPSPLSRSKSPDAIMGKKINRNKISDKKRSNDDKGKEEKEKKIKKEKKVPKFKLKLK